MPTTHKKLTTKLLDKMVDGEILRDSVVPGLLAERGKKRVSLKLSTELRRGPRTGEARKRKLIKRVLGQYPALSLDAARAEAMRLLCDIREGRDPRPQVTVAAPVDSAASSCWTVAQLFKEYQADLSARKKSPRTASDLDGLLLYLASWEAIVKRSKLKTLPTRTKLDSTIVSQALDDWRDMPFRRVTREMARGRHKCLAEIGEPIANKTMLALNTCFKFAIKVDSHVDNPVTAVTFFKPSEPEENPIPLQEVRGWYARLEQIPNPLRRLMHKIGVYTGLRPKNLMWCRREWIDFRLHSITIPAPFMKARLIFYMPMTPYIESLMRQALVLSEREFGDVPWLFPSYSRKGEVIPIQCHKEKLLPLETGYRLRHTYSNLVHLAKVNDEDRDLLLAHHKKAITGKYIDPLFALPGMLVQQHRATNFIRRVLEGNEEIEALLEEAARVPESSVVGLHANRLFDAQGLADALSTTVEEVEKMVTQGVPTIDVGGSARFEFSEVLVWLRSRKKHLRAVE